MCSHIEEKFWSICTFLTLRQVALLWPRECLYLVPVSNLSIISNVNHPSLLDQLSLLDLRISDFYNFTVLVTSQKLYLHRDEALGRLVKC